jgi:hypothetical protein
MHNLVRLQTGVRHVFLLALTAHGNIAVEALTHSPLLPLGYPIFLLHLVTACASVT